MYVCDISEHGVPQIFIVLIYVCDSSEQGVQQISIMQSSMMSVCLSVRMEPNISQTTLDRLGSAFLRIVNFRLFLWGCWEFIKNTWFICLY